MNKKGRSLSTIHPNLAREWHPTKNENLKPENVTSGSHNKVWWRCFEGHEWEVTVDNRSNGCRCPYGIGKSFLRKT